MSSDPTSERKVIAGRYELQRTLGRGGFSEVFLAYDRQLGRDVAIKQLFGSVADETFKRQREREIRIHSQISSKHVIALHNGFVFESCFYLDLELMDHSLAVCVEPVPWEPVAGWMREGLLGLRDVHAAGILHRDIKPGNLFIDRQGSVRVGDFGVARAGESISLQAISPQYIAPELLQGDQARVGPSSDLYSLGMVCYRLILGKQGMKQAFPQLYSGVKEGTEPSHLQWIAWHGRPDLQPQPLHVINPGIPQWLSDWVLRLVAKDPGQRYQTAVEVLSALGTSAPVTSPVLPAVTPNPTPAKLAQASPPNEPLWKRYRWGLVTVGMLGLVALTLLLLPNPPSPGRLHLSSVPSTGALQVRWQGTNPTLHRETGEYDLTPSDKGKLSVTNQNDTLVDSVLRVIPGQLVSIDLSSAVKHFQAIHDSLSQASQMSKLTIQTNVESKIRLEGVGAQTGQRVSFVLKPGDYQYAVKATGYQAKSGSIKVEANRDQTIDLDLSEQVARPVTTTSSLAKLTDIDGNVYHTVTIGRQVWMAENLKVTHYRNGDAVPYVTNNAAWADLTTAAYCNYNNDVSNVATYGRLYNWHAVADSRNIAPAGWHVPTDVEWQTLVISLGGDDVAGGKMKEVGTTHWLSPNTGATNESGFAALPGGHRFELFGTYHGTGGRAYFWSSTRSNDFSAWSRVLDCDNSEISRYDYDTEMGCSVRCVRDY